MHVPKQVSKTDNPDEIDPLVSLLADVRPNGTRRVMDAAGNVPEDEGDAMVANRWTLEDANSHLNEVLDQVKNDGPQELDRQGETFVIVTAEAWRLDKTERRSSLDTLSHSVGGVRQESKPERRSEWNDQEFRNPFAWVEEMSKEEVDVWEQRLNDARKRRIGAANSDER